MVVCDSEQTHNEQAMWMRSTPMRKRNRARKTSHHESGENSKPRSYVLFAFVLFVVVDKSVFFRIVLCCVLCCVCSSFAAY